MLRETVALDPRRRLHLVQCGQRQVVLLTGGSAGYSGRLDARAMSEDNAGFLLPLMLLLPASGMRSRSTLIWVRPDRPVRLLGSSNSPP